MNPGMPCQSRSRANCQSTSPDVSKKAKSSQPISGQRQGSDLGRQTGPGISSPPPHLPPPKAHTTRWATPIFTPTGAHYQTFLYYQNNIPPHPLSPAMAEIYDTDRFAELYYPSNTADLLQLGLAARFIASLFEAHQVTYAFIGGWAVYLRGGRRRTQDIDITVATTMDHLKQILTAQSRYLLDTFFYFSRSLLFSLG